MLTLRLAGGLGNQIFQIGAALLLATETSDKFLVVDDSALDSYEAKRDNWLPTFFDLSKLSCNIAFSKVFISGLRLPKLLPLKTPLLSLVSDSNFQDVLRAKSSRIYHLDGYFQSCLTQLTFDRILSILKNLYKLQMIESDPSLCVVHIRGSDFQGSSFELSQSYYEQTVKAMIDIYGVERFLVVTDDPQYSYEIINPLDVLYRISSGSVVPDFCTIASAGKKIISNSTFALWASALGASCNPVIISPESWHKKCSRSYRLNGEYPSLN